MEDFDHGIPANPYNKHAWILGDPHIGERVWIGAFCLIDALYAPLTIGRGTDVASGAQILTHSTVKRCISERKYGEVDFAATEIGEFCFIGANAVILMGVHMGDHSVIAAGAVVPQGMKIPPYSIVAGVPAKITGSSKKLLKGFEKDSLTISIPAFNEEGTIKDVIREADKAASSFTHDYEILIVDDGSTDKTGNIIDGLKKKNHHLVVIHHDKNKGFSGAMKTALGQSSKELIFLAPADGQFDFSDLPKFTEAIRGNDMVIGYREIREESYFRKFSSSISHWVYRILFNVPFREISSVFLWRKRVIHNITINAKDRSAMFLPEFFYKAMNLKCKYVEVPIHWYPRRGGKAKGRGLKTMIRTLEGLLILYWQKNISKHLSY